MRELSEIFAFRLLHPCEVTKPSLDWVLQRVYSSLHAYSVEEVELVEAIENQGVGDDEVLALLQLIQPPP